MDLGSVGVAVLAFVLVSLDRFGLLTDCGRFRCHRNGGGAGPPSLSGSLNSNTLVLNP